MLKLRGSSVLGFWMMACATAAPPPTRDAAADAAALDNLKRRDALQSQYDAAAHAHRERCEVMAGDCRIDVNDGRDKILHQYSSAECRSASDSDAEFACVAAALQKRGELHVTGEYYRLQSWCLQKLVECTDQLARSEQDSAHKAAAAARRARIESTRRGLAARAAVPFAEERSAYLRALLPPQADGACADATTLTQCVEHAQSGLQQFDAELAKDEDKYDEPAALAHYEAAYAAQAACHDPEFQCLRAKLDAFGGSTETHRYMAETLKSLERRQLLVVQVGDQVAKACLTSKLDQYQSRIVDDYQRFSREPVLFFQAQLHRDFKALYEAESSCLQSTLHSHSGLGPVAGSAPSPERLVAARGSAAE